MKKSQHSLFTRTPEGKEMESKQWTPNTPSTYLGGTSQVDGDQNAQIDKLIKTTRDISRRLCTCRMSNYYYQLYQQCSINPKITYSLTVVSLSDK